MDNMTVSMLGTTKRVRVVSVLTLLTCLRQASEMEMGHFIHPAALSSPDHPLSQNSLG